MGWCSVADRSKKPEHDDAWWAAQRHAYIEKNDILLSFRMPADIAHRKVLNSRFGSIKVTTREPLPMDVPVRFVDC